METKPQPQGPEPQKSPEPQETPEHLFVKDQLAGVSFLNPKTNERVTLKQRLGKIFPMYEAQVVAEFDRLKTVEKNRIADKYEEDAKRRARMILRDWNNEQRKMRHEAIVEYDDDLDRYVDKEELEDAGINRDEPLREESVFHTTMSPSQVRIAHEDYSEESSPEDTA